MKQKNYAVELLRCVCCLFVIWLHIPSNSYTSIFVDSALVPIAVPFFYFSSLTFSLISLKDTNTSSFWKKTISKLIIPYFFWTLLYSALLWVNQVVLAKQNDLSWVATLFYGHSAIQLYFIPQLVMMQCCLFAFERLKSSSSKKQLEGAATLTAVLVFLTIGYTQNFFGMTPPLALICYISGTYILRYLSMKDIK